MGWIDWAEKFFLIISHGITLKEKLDLESSVGLTGLAIPKWLLHTHFRYSVLLYMASAFSGVVWTSFMAPQVPKRKKGKLPVLSKNKPMSAGAALPLYLIVQSPCRLVQILGKGHGPVSSWRRNQKLWGIFNLTHFSLSCLISDEICFLLHSLPFSFPSFPLLLFIYIYIYILFLFCDGG